MVDSLWFNSIKPYSVFLNPFSLSSPAAGTWTGPKLPQSGFVSCKFDPRIPPSPLEKKSSTFGCLPCSSRVEGIPKTDGTWTDRESGGASRTAELCQICVWTQYRTFAWFSIAISCAKVGMSASQRGLIVTKYSMFSSFSP